MSNRISLALALLPVIAVSVAAQHNAQDAHSNDRDPKSTSKRPSPAPALPPTATPTIWNQKPSGDTLQELFPDPPKTAMQLRSEAEAAHDLAVSRVDEANKSVNDRERRWDEAAAAHNKAVRDEKRWVKDNPELPLDAPGHEEKKLIVDQTARDAAGAKAAYELAVKDAADLQAEELKTREALEKAKQVEKDASRPLSAPASQPSSRSEHHSPADRPDRSFTPSGNVHPDHDFDVTLRPARDHDSPSKPNKDK